jgi:5-methylcytosine-specific restriction enzyme A
MRMNRVTAARVADHVTPHKGDVHAFWYGELQSLCSVCHNTIKKKLDNKRDVIVVDVHGAPKNL